MTIPRCTVDGAPEETFPPSAPTNECTETVSETVSETIFQGGADEAGARPTSMDLDRNSNAARLLALLLGAACPASASPAPPDDPDWRLRIESTAENVRVYARTNGQGFPEFRGVTRVRSSLSALIALFSDTEAMPGWLYRTKEVRRIEVVNDNELFVYSVNNLPWPLLDRDSPFHVRIAQDEQTRVVRLTAKGLPNYLPEQHNRVRMPRVDAAWTFTPLPGGCVEVEFRGWGDPGGSLRFAPFRWFYERTVWEAPYETLLSLRRVIGEEKYQSHRSTFIREAPVNRIDSGLACG